MKNFSRKKIINNYFWDVFEIALKWSNYYIDAFKYWENAIYSDFEDIDDYIESCVSKPVKNKKFNSLTEAVLYYYHDVFEDILETYRSHLNSKYKKPYDWALANLTNSEIDLVVKIIKERNII